MLSLVISDYEFRVLRIISWKFLVDLAYLNHQHLHGTSTTIITITFVAIVIPSGQEFANRGPQGSQPPLPPPASPSSSLSSSSPFRKGRRVLTRATWITTTHRASRGPHISHHPPPVSPFPRSALYHCWCTLPKKKKKSKPVFVIDSS